ncbi:hypothetical protein H0H93_016400 [Arthromyces matolae]|nr:hypothetical protein H0H93_016400 [Arthromyces matolae]
MALDTSCFGHIRLHFLGSHFKLLPRNNKLQIRKSFNVWRVLALLVESGAVYGVLQLITVILSFAISYNEYYALLVFDVAANIYYSFSFVYPALTLYLIHGPLSLAGTHESVILAVISDDLASQELCPDGEVQA